MKSTPATELVRSDLEPEPPLNILVTVSGFLPHDSGKTRLTTRLILAFKELGIKAVAVKPIGGHSLWEQHFSIQYSMEHGVLVGGDAIRISRVTGYKPEEIEPIDLLLAPPDISRYLQRLRDYLTIVQELIPQTIMLRISRFTNEGLTHLHMFVREHIESLPPSLKQVVQDLIDSLKPTPIAISSQQLIDIMMSNQLVIHADIMIRPLLSRHRVGIVESFNDVLIPVPLSTYSKWFVVVAPGKAVVYRGKDVIEAAKLLAGIRPGSLRSSELLSIVKPATTIDIEFCSGDDIVSDDVRELAQLLVDRDRAETATR